MSFFYYNSKLLTYVFSKYLKREYFPQRLLDLYVKTIGSYAVFVNKNLFCFETYKLHENIDQLLKMSKF